MHIIVECINWMHSVYVITSWYDVQYKYAHIINGNTNWWYDLLKCMIYMYDGINKNIFSTMREYDA